MARRPGIRLRAKDQLTEIMASYFSGLGQADREGRPVAWCTSVGPAELLRAMGFEVYFPENHGAMLGATRTAEHVMPLAHSQGFSPDICSYLTSDIGAFLAGMTPLTKSHGLAHVPMPAVLVFNTNQCREVKDWFTWYGRKLGVPVLGIHSPRGLDAIDAELVAYVAGQLRVLKDDLAPIAPVPFHLQALQRTMALSKQASVLWRECLETTAASPAPWTFFDHTIHMAPIVVLRGTETAVSYYRSLLEELRALASTGQGAVPGERFRIYWEGMPIWGRLRALSELFSERGVALVASTYCNSWILEGQDPQDPWTSMAETYLSIFICRSEAFKQAYIIEKARELTAGGFVFHDSKTCPHNTNSRFGMPQRICKATGLPVLVLEGDLNDPRCFSLEEARVRIEVLLEQMEEQEGAP
ncbi:MAG: 2-hydroxyacyl-CoA dehydratase [Acidobacteria bacterium]|nr:2-hydroxyacyl-CoA dehydratase [Acidobacteriota bacterium]